MSASGPEDAAKRHARVDTIREQANGRYEIRSAATVRDIRHCPITVAVAGDRARLRPDGTGVRIGWRSPLPRTLGAALPLGGRDGAQW